MSIHDLFTRDAATALDVASLPGDQQTAHIRERATQLYLTEARLERAEALVEQIKTRRERIATRVLPELMDAAGTDTIGLPEVGVDVVVQPLVFASIKKNLPPEEREKMFAHLEEHGGGALPQAVVAISFPKEDLDQARQLKEFAERWMKSTYGNAPHPPVDLELTVHHGTLTSWLKATLERRAEHIADGYPVKPLALELLGATVGRICRIKKRKEKKSGGPRR